MKMFGIYGSIRFSLLLSGFVIVLVPFTSFIQGGDIALAMFDGERTPYRDATWTKLIFLAIILGFHRIFFSTASASVVVGLNRSIAPHHRAVVNQLNKIGGNIAKTFGPVLSGSMIASSFLLFGSDIQRFASVLAFSVLSVISISVSVLSMQLLGDCNLIESWNRLEKKKKQQLHHYDAEIVHTIDVALYIWFVSWLVRIVIACVHKYSFTRGTGAVRGMNQMLCHAFTTTNMTAMWIGRSYHRNRQYFFRCIIFVANRTFGCAFACSDCLTIV